MSLTKDDAQKILENTRKQMYGIIAQHVALNFGGEKPPVLAGKNKGPAIITASGPSLISAIPFLKECGIRIISGPSHKGFLELNGIHSDVVVYDHGPDMWPFVGTVHRDTTMYTHPGIHPIVERNWPNKSLVKWYWWFVLERMQRKEGETVKQYLEANHIKKNDPAAILYNNPYMVLINDYVPRLYQKLPRLIACACTSLQAAIIAIYEGYGPIYFVGLDFGWEEGREERAPKYTFKHRAWEPKESKPDMAPERYGGMLTTKKELYYRRVAASLSINKGFEMYNLAMPGRHSLAVLQTIKVEDFGNEDVLAKTRAEKDKYIELTTKRLERNEI